MLRRRLKVVNTKLCRLRLENYQLRAQLALALGERCAAARHGEPG